MNKKEITDFIDKFLENISKTELDITGLKMDHVAYQASNLESYESKKQEILPYIDYEHEAQVGGRRVGVYKLKEPLEYKGYQIEALEIIEPKEGQECEEGWEHGEFVLEESYEEYMAKHPNLAWITTSTDRPIYSHLKLALADKMQVKFHLMTILETIALEESQE